MRKEPLICATHYFSDCGVANFWSSFRISHLTQDFERIFKDGFTHIILIVPWALFQPSVESPTLHDQYLVRLDQIFQAAKSSNLKIILRLGFLWEISPVDQRTFYRFRYFFETPKLQIAWERYFQDLHFRYANNSVFEFAFVSWEDWYWSIYYEICIAPLENRLELADKIGFRKFLEQRYSLTQLNNRYNCTFQSWKEVPIPELGEPTIIEYLFFFDSVLTEKLYSSALSSFPGLQYEFRVDINSVVLASGEQTYTWLRHRTGCTRAIIYFHANIFTGKDSEVSVQTALSKLESLINKYQGGNSSCHFPFIDQLNFFNNHPDNSNMSKLKFSEIPTFLRESVKILRAATSGYGIWGYRDWPNEKTYNGAFEFGSEGWLLFNEKNIRVHSDGSGGLKLCDGMLLQQNVIDDSTPGEAKILLEAECSSATWLGIQIDESEEIVTSINPNKTEYLFEFNIPAKNTLSIRCHHGPIRIRRVALYSHLYTSGMYTRDFKERPPVSAIREVNSELRRHFNNQLN